MHIIHQQSYFPGHAQVAILDTESGNNYPEWEDPDNQRAIANQHGIAVATTPTYGDTFVEVVVAIGEGTIEGFFCVEHTILVGRYGLDVGDPVADYSNIAWPEGTVTISAYCNNIDPSKVTKVTFVLHS